MPRRDRKYNIWIAYSDLFTNLSTFLFISALGVFAAFGSGRLTQIGLGSMAACSVPPRAEQSLLQKPEGSMQPPSLLTSLTTPDGPEPECARYYKLGAARYHSSATAISGFAIASGNDPNVLRPLQTEEILSKICQPLWLLISRRDFREHEGRAVFRGIPSTEASGGPDPIRCEQRGQEPKILNWGVPERKSQMDFIKVCRNNRSAYNFCGAINDCQERLEGDRNSACQRVVAVIEWNRRAALACNEQEVRQQARTLYKICESAPSSDTFQDQLYRDPVTFVEEARYEDTRGVLWEQVGYDAYVRSRGRQTPLDDLPVGTIILEAQYSR